MVGHTAVSCIGFGAMGISAFYGATQPDEERFKVIKLKYWMGINLIEVPNKILDMAHARGCTFWDTADAYGDSEDLIGKW